MIVNLHGFNSAGNNNTFAQLSACFEKQAGLISPTYSVYNFSRGLAQLREVVETALDGSSAKSLVFVGSSTGAVFAESLAKIYPASVVLINPVTDPGILRGALGWNRNFRTEQAYEFSEQDLQTFSSADIEWDRPRLVLVERDDPVIDHHKTRKYYAGRGRYVEYPGDSHRFTFWEQGLQEIRAMVALPEAAI